MRLGSSPAYRRGMPQQEGCGLRHGAGLFSVASTGEKTRNGNGIKRISERSDRRRS